MVGYAGKKYQNISGAFELPTVPVMDVRSVPHQTEINQNAYRIWLEIL